MGGRPIVRCQRSRKNGGVSTMCICAGVHGMVIQGIQGVQGVQMGGRPKVWCQRSRGEKKNGGVSTMCFCAGVHEWLYRVQKRGVQRVQRKVNTSTQEHRSSGNNKCTRLRTLPQRNTEEFAVVGGVPFFVRQAQQNRHGIRPRRQHKHNRGFTRGYVVTRP